MFGLSAPEFLGLAVIAALVSTVGTLVGLVLKEYFFNRSFERWREKRQLLAIYRRYRDPLILAAEQLGHRLSQIEETYPTNFLQAELIEEHPTGLLANSANDPWFRRYRLVSTAYRFCAFLGWLELYRQDVTFLDMGKERINRQFRSEQRKLEGDLADGQLNRASDWRDWHDLLIFREEQRAIGDGMIGRTESVRSVIGYAAFCDLFDKASTDQSVWWLRVSRNFLLDLKAEKDFRRERLQGMTQHLQNMVELLRANSS